MLPPPTTATLIPTRCNVLSEHARQPRADRVGARRRQHEDRCSTGGRRRHRARAFTCRPEQSSARGPRRRHGHYGRGDRRCHRSRRHHRAAVPAVRYRRLLLGRHRPPDRRRASGAGDRPAGMDGLGPLVQRHLRRVAGRHDLVLGRRRRLRDRTELRRPRPRRGNGSLPCAGRALRGLCPRRFLAGGAGLGSGAPCRGRSGLAHRAPGAGACAFRRGRYRSCPDRCLQRHHRLWPVVRTGARAARCGRRRRCSTAGRRTRWPTK